MAGITLEIAEQRLQEYLDAELKVLAGQAVKLSDGGANHDLTLADLDKIQAGIKVWNERAKQLSASAQGRGRSRTVSPTW
jgi:hypothetical protein